MVSLQSVRSLYGMVLSGAVMLLLVGCDGGGAASSSATPGVQGPPPVDPAVAMESRPRPPRAPRSRSEVVAESVPATPAIPATPLVPAKPIPPRSPESLTVTPLGIGDAAPPLTIATWVTGDAVEGFDAGSVTVVEFWATWCGPCLRSMPHISELQTQYGDAVRFIGVTREEREVVDEFLTQDQSEGATWADVITYRLAIDEFDATNNAYMLAAGQNGIPCAFIVGKDGVVEWIGHPMEIDAPLEAIVNDRFDRDAAVAAMAAKKRIDEMTMALSSLRREEKWDEALAMLETIQRELDDVAAPYNAQRLLSMRLELLSAAGRSDEASALRSELVESGWDEPSLLNEIAWNTALSDDRSAADLETAFKAATRAAELTENADASILDTLARVYYEMGNLDQAIAWQEKAVALGEGNPSIEQTLKQYQAEQAGSGNDTPTAELDSGTVEVESRE